MSAFVVSEVRVGLARPFGPRGQPSAIDKQPVLGPVAVGRTGLAGDEQGNPRNHGGRDKATHAYPAATIRSGGRTSPMRPIASGPARSARTWSLKACTKPISASTIAGASARHC
jgi:hypothetical protein